MSGEFDIEERRTVLTEILGLRDEIRSLHDTAKGTAGKVEQIGVEQGRVNSFLTAHTVRADVEDTEQAPLNGLVGKTILIVDNEPVILRYLRRGLAHRGARVLVAGTVEEALAIVRVEHLHAALVDLRMPAVEHGMHIARTICRLHPDAGVVIISGRLDAPGLDALPVARLQKPFELEQLEHTLCGAMGTGAPSLRRTEPPGFDRGELPTQPGSRLALDTPRPTTAGETPEAKKRGE